MSLNVEGAIRNQFFDYWLNDDGTPMTRNAAYAYLIQCRNEGKRVIPLGKECEGFDYQKGCPGHPIDNEPQSLTAVAVGES